MTFSPARIADKVSGVLAARFGRRGFFARSAVVGSAIAANPVTYALKPTTAYAAVCDCYGSACECGSLCCDGYTEFCCTMTGANKCPPGTLMGGWWKVDGSGFCGGGPRYYMDCNAPCNGCGCGGSGVCDGGCSGTGCGCAQGSCDNRKAGCTLFRYGQCNQAVPCLGPILCRVVTCVPPWAIEPTCSTTVRVDNATAGHDRACLHAVVGSLDSADEASGGARLRGWTLDFDTQDPLTIHAYVDGKFVGAATANAYRPDVGAAYPGYGNNHGFDITVPVTPGAVRQVCVYGLNAGAGSVNQLLGCRNVRLSTPFGSFDSVTAGASGLRLQGWAIDPDTASSIKVHVYVDNAFKGEFTANASRPDVGAAYPGFGNNHGFDLTVPVGGGSHQVCIYAINAGAGSVNQLLGCRTVDVGTPFGSLDKIIPTAGGFRVQGWAIDPDTSSSIKVHVYVDGIFKGEFTADASRPDVGAAFPGAGNAHGFDAVVSAAPGSHSVCVYAINAGGGPNPIIGCRSASVQSGNPFGFLDKVLQGPGTARLVGWVLDPDTTGPIKVFVYADGTYKGEFTADTNRPDIGAAFPGYGPVHGFEADVPLSAGFRNLCVWASNTGAGENVLVACRGVQIGGDPFGSLDIVRAQPGGIRVAGWTIDPDTASPIKVHVYIDNVFRGEITADLSRPDIGAAFPLFGGGHGFDQVFSATPGSHEVCVYAINQASGSTNPLLACKTVTV